MDVIILTGRGRVNLWPIVWGLVVIVTCLSVYFILQLPAPNRNQLALGEGAPADVVEIQIQPPVELDFKTRADVLRLRVEAVRQHVELMSEAYSPAEAVFG